MKGLSCRGKPIGRRDAGAGSRCDVAAIVCGQQKAREGVANVLRLPHLSVCGLGPELSLSSGADVHPGDLRYENVPLSVHADRYDHAACVVSSQSIRRPGA